MRHTTNIEGLIKRKRKAARAEGKARAAATRSEAERLDLLAGAIDETSKDRQAASFAAIRRWRAMMAIAQHLGADLRLLAPVAASARWLAEFADLSQRGEIAVAQALVKEACPWASLDAINDAIDGSSNWRAKDIADGLGITLAMRDQWRLSLRAVSDMSTDEFCALLKERRREAQRRKLDEKRRAEGRPTREARAAGRTELKAAAQAAGVSERTMRRRVTMSVHSVRLVTNTSSGEPNCHPTVTSLAASLGISRKCLYARAKKAGLSVHSYVESLGLDVAVGASERPAACPTDADEVEVSSPLLGHDETREAVVVEFRRSAFSLAARLFAA